MKKLFLNLVFPLVFVMLTACSPDPKEAFKVLSQLEGQWKSTGNVIVYENWVMENDSVLTGFTFSERGNNKMILERYRLERNQDTVLFVILRPGKAIGADRYPMVKAWFGAYTFENTNAVYPNRILLDFDKDSIFVLRKENNRGNKRIEFEMKRWKE